MAWWDNAIDRFLPSALLDVCFSNGEGQDVLNFVYLFIQFLFLSFHGYGLIWKFKTPFRTVNWQCNILYGILIFHKRFLICIKIPVQHSFDSNCPGSVVSRVDVN